MNLAGVVLFQHGEALLVLAWLRQTRRLHRGVKRFIGKARRSCSLCEGTKLYHVVGDDGLPGQILIQVISLRLIITK